MIFNPEGKNPFGLECCYEQTFHDTDVILLQVIATSGETVAATLNDKVKNSSSPIQLTTYEQNSNRIIHYASLTSMDDSVYTVSVEGIGESEPFRVDSSDELLERTILFRYSNRDNNSFDNIFWIDDEQQFFYFRIEGGFKPEGYMPQVSNEQYRNQRQEIIELYSMPYDQWTLTLGDNVGFPVWYIRLVNRILSLSHVEIGGKLYVRSDASLPDKTQMMEDGQLFQATVLLEPKENDVAGMGGMPEPGGGQSVVGFVIENAKDGQMLQYDGDKSAFVNVTTVEV